MLSARRRSSTTARPSKLDPKRRPSNGLDTSKTRRARISRRERTYAYVTEGKRKLDDVLRRI